MYSQDNLNLNNSTDIHFKENFNIPLRLIPLIILQPAPRDQRDKKTRYYCMRIRARLRKGGCLA